MQQEVTQKIRALIGKYGLKAVREAVETESRQVFDYLKSVYVTQPVQNTIVLQETIVAVEEEDDVVIPEEQPFQEEGVKNVVVTGNAATVKAFTKEESKAKREKHDATVRYKHDELIQQNVEPSSLLTKENLSRWLAEKKTYWDIAEMTGCKDAEVSAKAKSFGLQSETSKHIIAKRLAKKKV